MFDKVAGRLGIAACAGLLLLSYLAMLIAGFFGAVPVFVIAGLASVLGEIALAAWSPSTRDLLERAKISRVYRHLARDLAVVLLLVAAVKLSSPQTSAVIVLPALVWAPAIASDVLSMAIERRQPVQVLTRNIDLGLPPRYRRKPGKIRALGRDAAFLNVLMIPGALMSAITGSLTPFVISAVATLAVAVVVATALTVIWMRGSRTAARKSDLAVFQDWLETYRPDVALYFAGPAKDVYQANMWLKPMEMLDRPAIVLLRSNSAFNDLAQTNLPVACVSSSVDFMNLALNSVRAALYPTNVGANIHMLREPGMKHVFVGHGDSDKQASVNPYSKVYDEVWVAGPAGRERYARAAVGVEDRDIVEIGRPQLDGVQRFTAGAGQRPYTVLYAPTWEGWLDDPYHSSLVLMGESIVRGLLEISPAVRVLYKPHPLTGTRGKGAAAIHARVVELIRAAGGRIGETSLDGSAHRVVIGPTPALFDCFNQTDLLISDVSSVVSDFVQSGRPYAVANPSGLSEDEFRTKYPTARAAYLLSPDCGELEKVVRVTRTGDDPMSDARRELKTYLLGPDEPSPLERFKAEVARLCD